MKEIMLMGCVMGIFAFMFFVTGKLDDWLEEQGNRESNACEGLALTREEAGLDRKGDCRRKQGRGDMYDCSKCEKIKLQAKNT